MIVLPFDNLSGKSEEDYFANGMTEALITDLSRIPTLNVISRTSSMRYKSLGKSPQDLARELRIQAVVDGTVLRSEGQVRISVRLVDAATDRNLWGREYTRELRDVLALQGEVARAIAGEIRASFAPADEERLKNAPPVNPEAHEEFLKGSHHWNRRTEDALRLAIAHFRRALELQPDHAAAYAGLARSYVVLPAFPIGGMPPEEAYSQVIHNAERAITLDERLAEAHAALAYVRLHSLDGEGAEASFRRALDLNPGDPTTRFWYAAALASTGRFDVAIEEARQAAALDPVAPIITAGVSWMHHLARRFDLEIEAAHEALRLEPNFMIARYRLGEGYLNLGRYDEAIVEFTKAYELSGQSPDLLAALAYARGRAGQRREALAALRALNELAATRYVSSYAVALVHTGLGDFDEAIRGLERAIDERAWGVVYLPVEPDLDPLRSDPRFDALVARVKTPRP